MTEEFDPEIATVTVTCRTDGCGNQGEALDVPVVLPDPFVICGACGNPIADIRGLPE
jgi:hypothetical protein